MDDRQPGDNQKRHLTEEQKAQVLEKVYLLWLHDLEILRERRRLHGRTLRKR